MSTSSKPRITIILITALSLVVLITLITLTFMLFLILHITSSNPLFESFKSHKYELRELKVTNGPPNYQNIGIISLPRPLKTGDYISYDNNLGSSFLVTPFGGTEFECSGTCFCSTESERRNTQVLSRGLMIIISAFSVTMSLQLAKESFDRYCIYHFSETCSSENIISEVGSCEAKAETENNEDENENVSPVNDIPRPDEFNWGQVAKKDYFCTGYCLSYESVSDEIFELSLPGIHRDQFIAQGRQKVGECEKLVLEKEFHIYTLDGETNYALYLHDLQNPDREFEEELDEVGGPLELVFAFDMLDPYCREMSLMKGAEFPAKSKKMLRERINSIRDDPPLITSRYDLPYEQFIMAMKEWVRQRPYCFGSMIVKEDKGPHAGRYAYKYDHVRCTRIEKEEEVEEEEKIDWKKTLKKGKWVAQKPPRKTAKKPVKKPVRKPRKKKE